MALFSLTLSAFVTSTIAWFAVSDILQVRNISIGYNSEDFQIGLMKNGTVDYSAAVNVDEQVKLTPVSSMYQSKWYSVSDLADLTKVDATFPQFMTSYPSYTDGKADIHETGYATEGYYQMELYFSSNKDTYVFLDATTSLAANAAQNAAIAAQTGDAVSDLNKVSDCLRVSFYGDEGYTIYEPNVASGSATPLAGRLDVLHSDGYYDYDDNNREILYGDYNYDSCTLAYDAANPASPVATTTATNGFDAITKPGVQPLDIAESTNLAITKEPTYSLSDLTLTAAIQHPLLFIPANGVRRMVLSLYVEGWDRDCVNSVKDASFLASVVFSGRYEPAGSYQSTYSSAQ
jgi:hypothetical protein